MAERTQAAIARFGAFEVNLRTGELRKHGLRVRVSGQPFKILKALLERPGEVVTREELRRSLWPEDTFVDFEHNLNTAVKKLREALRDSAENSRYIETLPRLGYRFIAPVTSDDYAAPAHTAPRTGKGFVAGPRPAESVAAARALPGRGPYDAARRVRRALGLGALLSIVAAAVFVSVSLRRPRRLPFEVVRTTRLTSAGQSFKAAISPDGRYIAHTVLAAGRESLRVRQTTALHDIEVLPPRPVRYVGITFSPDSETLYYVTQATGTEPSALYRIPAMGGPAQKLKENLDSPVTFSPDGKRFAFTRESPSEKFLMIADLDSGAERKLTSHKLPEALDYPSWSPDGQLIACTAYDSASTSPKGSNARIIGVRVQDGTERTLSRRSWWFIRQLAWLGDGRGLVMSGRGEESGIFHIWYLSYPGGIARKVTDGLNYQIGVSVSAHPRQIATVEESTLFAIWRTPSIQAKAPEPFVAGSNGTSAPRWTTSDRVVFEQELSGHRTIWIADADGTNQKQLTPAGNNYHPSISGEGRTIAYISDRSGSPAIWTMDIDGGNWVMVAKAWAETTPQLSPDGKWIVYTAIGSGQWTTLWKVASSGGHAIELNDKLWMQPAISPDGKWIAGFYADRQLGTEAKPAGIAVIGIDGGQPWKMIPMPPSVSTFAGIRWRADGRELTYVDRGADGDNIWSQSLAGGVPRQLTSFHGEALFGFDWSRDGKQLVFSRGIQSRDVVLIQDAQDR